MYNVYVKVYYYYTILFLYVYNVLRMQKLQYTLALPECFKKFRMKKGLDLTDLTYKNGKGVESVNLILEPKSDCCHGNEDFDKLPASKLVHYGLV